MQIEINFNKSLVEIAGLSRFLLVLSRNAEFQAGRKIIEQLKGIAPDDAVLSRDSVWFAAEMEKLGK